MPEEYEWPKIKKARQEPLLYTTNEERDTYISEVSGNRWWIKQYLEHSLPFIY